MTPRNVTRTACGLLSCAAVLLISPAMAEGSSANNIAPWESVTRLPGGEVRSVVFNKAYPGVAFAGSSSALIYRSTDGGLNWKAITVGGVGEEFRAIAVSPAQPSTVYAYSSDQFYSGRGTVYRSVDDGLTWKALPNQPGSVVTNSYFAGLGRGIAIDPTGKILVLTDANSGVLRSSDAGSTWSNPISNAIAYGLAKDPAQPGVLWAAGLDFTTGMASIWKSTDFGASWTVQAPAVINPPQVANLLGYAIAIQPGTGTIVANWTGFDLSTFRLTGGVVISKDGGNTWAASNQGLLPSYSPGVASGSIAFDPAQAGTIYLSTDGDGSLNGDGFYRSLDSGQSWQPFATLRRTLASFGVWVRPIMAGYPAAVFSGSPDLFASTDHAATWVRADRGLNDGIALSIVNDGLSEDGYYAATGSGVFHSTTEGESWSRISTWNGFDGPGRAAVDLRSETRTVYVASYDHVWRSSDAGHSWVDVSPPAAAGSILAWAYTNPHRANDVYAVSSSASGVTIFHSKNGGGTWTSAVCGGADDSMVGFGNLFVSAASPGRLYIPRYSGLWTANEDGSNCQLSAVQPLPPYSIYAIAEAGRNPTALLVSGWSADGTPVVMRSADNGASYQPVGALPGVSYLSPWLVSSSPNLRVAVAVFGGSTVALSRDGGATWTTAPDVLFPVTTGFSYLSATDEKVFLGDYNAPIFAAPYEDLH